MSAAEDEVELMAGDIPIGGTRPPMVPRIGIPLSAALPLGVVCVEVQMAITGFLGVVYAAVILLAIAVPLRVWISFDWYGLEVLMVWLRTMARALDRWKWGGASMSPFPLHPKNRQADRRGV
jgi:type IV secretory pathway VirB3-like protein